MHVVIVQDFVIVIYTKKCDTCNLLKVCYFKLKDNLNKQKTKQNKKIIILSVNRSTSPRLGDRFLVSS